MSTFVYRRVGWKYVLTAHYRKTRLPAALSMTLDDIPTPLIALPGDGSLLIRAGYAWNGASGPTLDTDDTMEPSLVHDALYQLMREWCLPQSARKAADKLMRQMLKQQGMPYLRRWYWYWFLRWCGGKAAEVK